jgi:hypothetical protein
MHDGSRLHRIRHFVRPADVGCDSVLSSQIMPPAFTQPQKIRLDGAGGTFGCDFCVRSNCVNANRDIPPFPRSKKPHAFLPLPLPAADVGCCAALGLDSQRCRGLLFCALLSKGLVTALSCCRPTSSGIGQRNCCTSPSWAEYSASTYTPVGAFLSPQAKLTRSDGSRSKPSPPCRLQSLDWTAHGWRS